MSAAYFNLFFASTYTFARLTYTSKLCLSGALVILEFEIATVLLLVIIVELAAVTLDCRELEA